MGRSLGEGRHLISTVDAFCLSQEIRKMVEQAPEEGMVLGLTSFVDDESPLWVELDETTGKKERVRLPESLNLKAKNEVGGCFLYTRHVYRAIGEYNPHLEMVEDYDYWIRIAKQFKMAHIPKALYIYGEHSNSLTNKKIGNVRLLDKLLKFHHGFISLKELHRGMEEYLMSSQGTADSFFEFFVIIKQSLI